MQSACPRSSRSSSRAATAAITFVVAREQGRKIYEVDIGDGFQINPALAGAIKSFDGVVDVRLG